MWEDAAVELRGSKTEANLITAFSGEMCIRDSVETGRAVILLEKA